MSDFNIFHLVVQSKSLAILLFCFTSTIASGINASFTGLSYGYYTVLVEIEDSSTGADAGLEKCIFEIPVDVKAKVCTGL